MIIDFGQDHTRGHPNSDNFREPSLNFLSLQGGQVIFYSEDINTKVNDYKGPLPTWGHDFFLSDYGYYRANEMGKELAVH